MNVLVCDDDQQIVDSIIEELKKKSEETHVSSRFYGFFQPSQIDLSLPYDIALLDIDMGETNGIELARKLRASNENIVIIFITNFIQYAPEGFEVQAFRYLLKADLSAKLDSYFDSAVQEVLRRKQLVTISINSEIIDVPVNDILYLESHRRIIVMHLLDESGYVKAGEDGITTAKGLFVAGDVRTTPLRQVITAAADGANALSSAEKYIMEL
jgi:DNA-binding LytR/AlgR family response regulator